MSFKAYIIQPFQTSHENEFFRLVTQQLKEKYGGEPDKSVFVGNLSCGGHLLDAIFIKKGKIIIIDFKDYGGKIEFSENNPWKNIDDNGKLVFVSGGGGIRNPYQQVNAYRFSLMNVLSNNKADILSPNHIDVKWDHINCIVLFHKTIQFEGKNIPEKIKNFFKIADKNNYIQTLDDRYSSHLELNDNEIEKILKVLDVKPDNEYDTKLDYKKKDRKTTIDRSGRFGFLKKMMTDISNDVVEKRLLHYYHAIIDLERYKAPNVRDLYDYPINWKDIDDEIELDFSKNNGFEAILQESKQKQFPNDIFIGIKVKLVNEELPILQYVQLSKDINGNKCKLSPKDFDFYTKPFEEKELPEDLIDEIVSEIATKNSIEEKLNLIKQKLDIEIELLPKLAVGLNNESTFTLQLSSELNKLIKKINTGSNLFNQYLQNQKLIDKTNNFKFNPYIRITPLNESQKRALQLSFNQPLTVVTGPPGTGKTQLVLNIIANAIINNKSILFASKNNKAVDNVKEKLDKLLKEKDYIMRFGPRNDVKDITKPKIEGYLNKINIVKFEKENGFDIAKTKLEDTYAKLSELDKKLKRIDGLKNELIHIKSLILNEENSYGKWIGSIPKELQILFLEEDISFAIDESLFSYLFTKLRNFNSNSITRLWFNLFLKDKYFGILHSEHIKINQNIKDYIEHTSPLISMNISALISFINYIDFIQNLKNESVKIKSRKQEFITKLESLKENLQKSETEFNTLLSIKGNLEIERGNLTTDVPIVGLEYLNNFILRKLDNANKVYLSSYTYYIPDNIPWKEEEIENFEISSKNFLQEFSSIITTNLAIKNGFPLTEELFDLVVIDEASQCDIASSLPLVYRAKQLVVIGDPLQLKHITNIDSYEEKYIQEQYKLTSMKLDYVNNSLYDYCYNLSVRSNYESILLNEHYRSCKDIIEYSNLNFYLPRLGQELLVKTKESDLLSESNGITWYNVNGLVPPQRNINNSEIIKCLTLVEELSAKYPNASIGITTPFKNQAKNIFNRLPESLKRKVLADTVHKFQGDEKDIILLSLVVADGCPIGKANWLNYSVPYLLNVAITRARSILIIVGDYNYCRSLTHGGPTPLSQLANYVHSLGRVVDL